jgi:hypothetical protein
MLINYIGPVSLMNTALFERMHQLFKADLSHTNRKNIGQDLLLHAATVIATEISGFRDDLLLPSEEVQANEDMTTYGTGVTTASTPEVEQALFEVLSYLGTENWSCAPYYSTFPGFHLGGQRIATGSYVAFSAPIQLLYENEEIWSVRDPELADQVLPSTRVEFIAQVAVVAKFKLTAPVPLPNCWMKLQLLFDDGDDASLRCPCFTSGRSIWLPCAPTALEALEWVHVLRHPTHPENFVYNRWLRRTIKSYAVRDERA